MAGLYFHIPFCRQRCSYCDFYFVTGSRDITPFVETLIAEVETTPAGFRDETVETVYFGGGTPSRLSLDELRRVVDTASRAFSISRDAEWTIEVNPDDCSPEFLSGLKRLGFNRLSIGLQSLKQGDLEFMRRTHSVKQAEEVVDMAFKAEFGRFSVDLIFGLPGQTMDEWLAHLDFVIDREIPHVSTYGLTVEPQTLLNKWIRDGLAPAPDPDMAADLYVSTMSILEAAGYRHYEISSFARPGAESRHNQSYWSHQNYLGFGPSAHSFWWADGAERWSNVRSLRKYLEWGIDRGRGKANPNRPRPEDWRESLSPETLAEEYVMLRLRTSRGIHRDELASRYGFAVSELGEALVAELVDEGLLEDDGSAITLTQSGKLLADTISVRLCEEGRLQASIQSSGALEREVSSAGL